MCSVAVSSRLRLAVLALAASALLLLTAGCQSHYVAHGRALYADGRYVEAAEVFERTESRLASSSRSERARFGLYRGATFLRLGDVEHAARWLGYAREIVKADRAALDDDETALLDASLRALVSDQPAAPGHSDSEVAAAPPASPPTLAQ